MPNLWFHGGNFHPSRHDSLSLAVHLKARVEGLPASVYGLQDVHHLSWDPSNPGLAILNPFRWRLPRIRSMTCHVRRSRILCPLRLPTSPVLHSY